MPVVRSTTGQTSFLGKLAAYRDIIAHQIHKAHWGIPNLLVLTVTVSASRVQEILNRLQDGPSENAAFLINAVAASDLTAPMPQLLIEPWQRAGFPPLRIDQ
jgi:hypothetical protein